MTQNNLNELRLAREIDNALENWSILSLDEGEANLRSLLQAGGFYEDREMEIEMPDPALAENARQRVFDLLRKPGTVEAISSVQGDSLNLISELINDEQEFANLRGTIEEAKIKKVKEFAAELDRFMELEEFDGENSRGMSMQDWLDESAEREEQIASVLLSRLGVLAIRFMKRENQEALHDWLLFADTSRYKKALAALKEVGIGL